MKGAYKRSAVAQWCAVKSCVEATSGRVVVGVHLGLAGLDCVSEDKRVGMVGLPSSQSFDINKMVGASE